MSNDQQDLSNLPLIDMQIMARLINDTSRETAETIVSLFLPELDKLDAKIEQYHQGSLDYIALRDGAHLCKSTAAYCGASQFQQYCQCLETACNAEDDQQIYVLLHDSTEIINNTRNELKNYLDT